MPANRDEAVGHLVSDGFADNNGNMAGDKDFDEAQAWENAWQAMDKFIEQDAYLSKHRGEYTKRNGAVAPFANQLDLSISHDIIRSATVASTSCDSVSTLTTSSTCSTATGV